MGCLYFIYVAFVEVSAWNSTLYKLVFISIVSDLSCLIVNKRILFILNFLFCFAPTILITFSCSDNYQAGIPFDLALNLTFIVLPPWTKSLILLENQKYIFQYWPCQPGIRLNSESLKAFPKTSSSNCLTICSKICGR